jgi:hypothetical protein
VQLKSADQDWPAEFELTMDFALVGAKESAVNNSLWAQFPEPVKLVLHDANGKKNTTLTLGRDTAVTAQSLARLQLDNKAITLTANDFPKTGPLRLTLKRNSKGKVEGTLGQKKIGPVPCADTIHALTLHVDNPDNEVLGQRWYVAIYRLDVAWSGLSAAKAQNP